jgi:hypothetical protein
MRFEYINSDISKEIRSTFLSAKSMFVAKFPKTIDFPTLTWPAKTVSVLGKRPPSVFSSKNFQLVGSGL